MAQTDESGAHVVPTELLIPAEANPRVTPDAQSAAARRPPMRAARARPWRLLALPAVALAAYAEWLVAQGRDGPLPTAPTPAWWLFGGAALLFAAAAWPVPALRPALPAPFLEAWGDRPRRARFVVPLGL